MRVRYLVVGGGVGAGYAARSLVEHGAAPGEVAVLSEEPSSPYRRSRLAAHFLGPSPGKSGLLLQPPAFYTRHGILLELGCRVESVDVAQQSVRLHDRRLIRYDWLIAATGSSPRPLLAHGRTYPTCRFHSLADAERVARAAQPGAAAVVVGAGLLGMEIAAALAGRGLQVKLVERRRSVGPTWLPSSVSTAYAEALARAGVDVVTCTEAVAVTRNGRRRTVSTSSGAEMRADLVVTACGLKPNCRPFISQLCINRALLASMDTECLASPRVLAVGCAAELWDARSCRFRLSNGEAFARATGTHAGLVALGQRSSPIRFTPTRESAALGLPWRVTGDWSPDAEPLVAGHPQEGHWLCVWQREGRAVGVALGGAYAHTHRWLARELLGGRIRPAEAMAAARR